MVNCKRVLSLTMALIMVFSFVTLAFSASYYDDGTAYDSAGQGKGGDTLTVLAGENEVKYLGSEKDIIYNKITALYDSTGAVSFNFKLSEGVTDFKEGSFIFENLPLIKVLDDTGVTTVAEYANGAGKLSYGGTTKAADGTVQYLTVSVAAGTLKADTVYMLVFDGAVHGNKAEKNLGVDIAFFFKTEPEKVEPPTNPPQLFIAKYVKVLNDAFYSVYRTIVSIYNYVRSLIFNDNQI